MRRVTLYGDRGKYVLKDLGMYSLAKEDGGSVYGKLLKLTKNGSPYLLFITDEVQPGKYLLGREPAPSKRLARKLEKYRGKLELYKEQGKERRAKKMEKKLEKLKPVPRGGVTVYVLPGETYPLPDAKEKPAFNLGKVFERPITGMAATSLGAGLAYSGAIAGSALGALYGALLMSSLGFLWFLPPLLKGLYRAGKRINAYAKGEKLPPRKKERKLLKNAPKIVQELEKLLAPQQYKTSKDSS